MATARRAFTTTRQLQDYASTLPNLRIGAHTRVLIQGFTGRLATANAAESIAWGTRVVGGTKPGYTGTHLGLPVLPSVRAAVAHLHPDATAIYVPAAQAAAAIEEAVAAEVPLVVAVAEHIPLHAMLRVHALLRTQSRSRLVGANAPGLVAARGRCRLGFAPLGCFAAGVVGVAARSGTLSYEAVAATTRAGLGQSLCIGVGGDVLPGTDLREALEVLAADEETRAIALIGEIGGEGEVEAAEWIREYNARVLDPKPVVALVAGINVARGKIMGHAGAITLPGEPDAREKIKRLEEAGATIVNHPEQFGEAIHARLGSRHATIRDPSSGDGRSGVGSEQRRRYHTAVRRLDGHSLRFSLTREQRRHIYLSERQSLDVLRERGHFTFAGHSGVEEGRLLAIGIDRKSRRPCILATPPASPDRRLKEIRRFPFDFAASAADLSLADVVQHMQLGKRSTDSLCRVLGGLIELFHEKEALLLETEVVDGPDGLAVANAHFAFDDAPFKTHNRQADMQAMSDRATEDAAEMEAKKHGIAYIRLPGEGSIGTLVNGAGLAMNTVDAIIGLGGKPANFLDTGGLATSMTVQRSFEVILRDPRVRVILVNIFGGLTLGDMIAQGILMAFTETSVGVPVVVRIRGTNEKQGQKLIAESGLPLYAFDNFQEAAAKAIELCSGPPEERSTSTIQ